jgi:hypothetical protein
VSQSNVDVVRDQFAAPNERDFPRAMSHYAARNWSPSTRIGGVREVSDSFLLQMAKISAGLFGLFLVGMLFFVETGFRRLGAEREAVVHHFRASTRIVLMLFAIPLGLSLTLVVLEPGWSTVLFALLSLALITANLDTALCIQDVRRLTGSKVLGTIGVVLIVLVPWALVESIRVAKTSPGRSSSPSAPRSSVSRRCCCRSSTSRCPSADDPS